MQASRMTFPSENEVDAAASALLVEGVQHGWWPNGTEFDKLGIVERTMLRNIVERVLVIAAKAAATR